MSTPLTPKTPTPEPTELSTPTELPAPKTPEPNPPEPAPAVLKPAAVLVPPAMKPPVPPIALHALAVLFAAVLCVLVASAWMPNGPDLSSAYSTVGTGLVGLVVNRHGSDQPWQRWLSKAWDVLVVLALLACVANGIAMFFPGTNHTHAGAAFVATLAALAGLFLNTARLMPGI